MEITLDQASAIHTIATSIRYDYNDYSDDPVTVKVEDTNIKGAIAVTAAHKVFLVGPDGNRMQLGSE